MHSGSPWGSLFLWNMRMMIGPFSRDHYYGDDPSYQVPYLGWETGNRRSPHITLAGEGVLAGAGFSHIPGCSQYSVVCSQEVMQQTTRNVAEATAPGCPQPPAPPSPAAHPRYKAGVDSRHLEWLCPSHSLPPAHPGALGLPLGLACTPSPLNAQLPVHTEATMGPHRGQNGRESGLQLGGLQGGGST